MSAGKVIYNLLSNTAGITAIVGSGNNCRIYPLVANQNYDIPCIVFSEISTTPNATKSGVSTMDESLYQLDIMASTRANAETLANLVRTALDYASGTYAGVTLGHSTFLQSRDTWNEFAKNTGVAMIQVDYKLFIQR